VVKLVRPVIRRIMKRKQIYLFNDGSAFFQMEEQAIDGQLDYDDFPPEEYRYFSKLSKLGYKNRHNGWSKELCEMKQEEYRKEYREACEERDLRVEYAKKLQANLIRSAELSRQLNLADTSDAALITALDLLEMLLNEPGLSRRIQRNIHFA